MKLNQTGTYQIKIPVWFKLLLVRVGLVSCNDQFGLILYYEKESFMEGSGDTEMGHMIKPVRTKIPVWLKLLLV